MRRHAPHIGALAFESMSGLVRIASTHRECLPPAHVSPPNLHSLGATSRKPWHEPCSGYVTIAAKDASLSMSSLMRYADGVWPNAAVLAYIGLGYPAAISLLVTASATLNAIGVVLLAHVLVIAAYLIHECAHNTLFADNRYNAYLGEALSFLVGAAYVEYAAIRRKHFRHHTDRADVVAIDYRAILRRHPLTLRLVQILEWVYVPAVDLMMHGLTLVLPFVSDSRRSKRRPVLMMSFIRASLFLALAAISMKAFLLYGVAYILFLHVMRFMDVHQHTYSLVTSLDHTGEPREMPDRDFEQRNTYSNLISRRYPALNLLVLNFCYHNAHHARPTVPWYRLPQLHRDLGGDTTSHALPMRALLMSYHRYRVARVLHADPPDTDIIDPSQFVGVTGVSFLTAH